MAKKFKTGTIELPPEAFDESTMTAHISLRLPLLLLKDLRRAALTEKYAGKYQVLIRDVLTEWIANHKPKKKHG